MKVTVVYNNKKDKEYMSKIDTPSFFINYINLNASKSRSEGFKVLNYWSAKKLPFVEVKDDEDKIVKVFYSEFGNSVNQFIKWINESKYQET